MKAVVFVRELMLEHVKNVKPAIISRMTQQKLVPLVALGST